MLLLDSIVKVHALSRRREVLVTVPAHLQQKETYYHHRIEPSASGRPRKPQVDICKISRSSHRSPGLFRIPVPEVPPSLLCPYGTGKKTYEQKPSTDVYKVVYRIQIIPPPVGKSCHGKDERTGQNPVGKHIHRHMRNEKHALQCRHQRLVMNLRLQDIYDTENRRKHCSEQRQPAIPPAAIDHQTGNKHEKGIPETCLTHCPHGRSAQKYPETGYKDTHHQYRSKVQQLGNPRYRLAAQPGSSQVLEHGKSGPSQRQHH